MEKGHCARSGLGPGIPPVSPSRAHVCVTLHAAPAWMPHCVPVALRRPSARWPRPRHHDAPRTRFVAAPVHASAQPPRDNWCHGHNQTPTTTLELERELTIVDRNGLGPPVFNLVAYGHRPSLDSYKNQHRLHALSFSPSKFLT